jgi:hypothetical protein
MAGFNTEVKYKGAVFHVQTQDVGPNARCIETFVYKSGKLLSSRKTFYTSFLGSPQLQDKIQQIMDEQHGAVLKDISDGKFEHYLSAEEKENDSPKS